MKGLKVLSLLLMLMPAIRTTAQIEFWPSLTPQEITFPSVNYKAFVPTLDKQHLPKAQELTGKFNFNALPTPTILRIKNPIQSEAYELLFDPFLPMHAGMNPFAFDFNEMDLKPINEHLSLLMNGYQNTWPGLGGNTILNTTLQWHTDKWVVAGGAFGGRYFTPINPISSFTGGLTLDATYKATDWLSLRSWGQYANQAKNQNDPFFYYGNGFNHSQVGGAMEFKISDNFGVGMGINYEFNPMKHKMEKQWLVYPVFYHDQ
ncbi:MAG: hypothetical protein M0P33_07490 [Massilibacteroides sp.]|nr:hypothetical protein [Massilibacteroides sp.]